MPMAEPSSSAAAGGFAAYKLAVAFGLPAGVAAIVVMLWIQPKSPREWALALISTVASSVGGGAALIQHLGLNAWADNTVGLIGMAGLIFACGLPGWVIVRAAFAWIDRRRGRDLAELASDAAHTVRDVIGVRAQQQPPDADADDQPSVDACAACAARAESAAPASVPSAAVEGSA